MPGRTLSRRLGTTDAVVIGLSSMIGAGVFSAFAPAAAAAGSGLLLGLVLAAGVAYANASSSAALAALHPQSGGTYVYGRERLGPWWGFTAGWAFVIGKTASCAAMALTVAAYVAPSHPRLVAVGAVVAITVVNHFGVTKTSAVARVLLVLTLLALGVTLAAVFGGGRLSAEGLGSAASWTDHGPRGVLQSAGLLFFAFAGYARIATMGEEVRDPGRTIGRAIRIALAVALLLYTAVAVGLLLALGPIDLASSASPLADAVAAGRLGVTSPVVRVGAMLASLGALLALFTGIGRTVLAMARRGDLPSPLASVHPRYAVPDRADLALMIVVCVLVATLDLRGAIGFSSFGVLVYYAIANMSAMTLTRVERRSPRALPVLGALGCVLLAVALPWTSVVPGVAVLVVGWVARAAARAVRRPTG